jgi:D-alanine--poly(phosphoribitol) ligase subunit 2
MAIDDLRAELRQYVMTRFQIPPDDPQFSDSVNLFDFGYIDSMGAVELVDIIEKRLSLEIAAADWNEFKLDSIDSIMAFVSAKQRS